MRITRILGFNIKDHQEQRILKATVASCSLLMSWLHLNSNLCHFVLIFPLKLFFFVMKWKDMLVSYMMVWVLSHVGWSWRGRMLVSIVRTFRPSPTPATKLKTSGFKWVWTSYHSLSPIFLPNFLSYVINFGSSQVHALEHQPSSAKSGKLDRSLTELRQPTRGTVWQNEQCSCRSFIHRT